MFFHQNEEAFFNFFITIFFILSFFFTNTLIISSFFFKVDFIFICFLFLFIFCFVLFLFCFFFNYWFNFLMINNFSFINTINFYFWFLVKLFLSFYKQLFYIYDNYFIFGLFLKITKILKTNSYNKIIIILTSINTCFVYLLFVNYFSINNIYIKSLVKFF